MNLLEYEAKAILSSSGILVPYGRVVRDSTVPDVGFPTIVKSQIPIGGRGKAGGVRLVNDTEELRQAIMAIMILDIKGFTPTSVLVEEALDIEREYYLSIVIDRTSSSIELVVHTEGGIEVESNDSEEFYRRRLSGVSVDAIGQELADYLNLPEKAFILIDLIEKLLACFINSDALMIEINPLVLTASGDLVAGDCKMTLDNAARFRHEDWDFEHMSASTNFVTLDEAGTIATIVNGAGLAMATVDAVRGAGLTPANFLDIGGNATTEGVINSFNQLVKYNNLTNIIINIFGGIVRCDTVARAIIEARHAIPTLPPLLIRLSGTNSVEARALLEKEGLVLHDTLESCLTEITR